ncbi:MAG: hypothetical protein AUJ60_01995 [Nitrospirae bacterium CG1_02_44_142]|nr:MAG: hypothetical protein AUJ60_01995 [Nitrospirae bacterium CG1_02_44_142]
MRKSLVLGDITDSELEEFNTATETMRRNRLRFASTEDVDSYFQFLEDRQALFNTSQTIHRECSIEKSHIL